MPSQKSHRRGGMYIAVLMTAMIVAIVGLSALSAARLQLKTSVEDANLAAAQGLAQSAIEMGILALTRDPQWRSTYSHNTWTSAVALGDGSYCWKLADEVNGSLTANATAPVRIYGRGIAGVAQRILSVLIADVTPELPNLLQNPGMEDGTNGWTAAYACTIATQSSLKYSGSAAMLVSSRAYWYCGLSQTLTGSLKDGVIYEVQAWVRPRTTASSMRYYLHVNSSGNGDLWPLADVGSSTLGSWKLLQGEIQPDWDGTLNSARLLICTSSGTNDFYIDDVLVREKRLGSDIKIIPGTWRWEVGTDAPLLPESGPILPETAGALKAFGVAGQQSVFGS